mmetsp:Transcript_75004/g.173952  ORF Transcript_75004/g.173952 Transcript_75004/m.173952 type:complete len:224 (+) Transcript_75004:105-776(+)|eukprot:CAMPEP_0171129670 /NCGR_PEP_ID=MMETSP0766_2-20121228/119452_1 /TAXON_ID=439317 /ORGANISM="Gambierdiscus australes, Strain CAWD 149" /LENGTH=223 /DNA_ID=CAMNT_0011592883 /DNA_START=16 /DNA_END=687 /DNA_ORIENTATION=+
MSATGEVDTEHGGPVTLNVGGVLYTTCGTTLRKAPFFAALFRHTEDAEPAVQMQSTLDAGGRLFLDRDGQVFNDVLAFLRTDRLPRYATREDRERLLAELAFFGLDAPHSWVEGREETAMLLWCTNKQFSMKSSVSFLASRELCDELLQLCDWDSDAQVTRNQVRLTKAMAHEEVLAFASALESELSLMGFREHGPTEQFCVGVEWPNSVRRKFSRQRTLMHV